MRITVTYGGKPFSFSVPSHIQVETFQPSEIQTPIPFEDFKGEWISAHIDHLIGKAPVLFVVNDAYRPTPTVQALDWCEEMSPGIHDRSQFLIATGSHEIPNEEQLKIIFGHHLDNLRARISVHMASDLESMIKIGTDSFVGDVYLNRQFVEAKAVIVIGSVEPHYFAGFTGGRKSIFPGLTNLEIIEKNHNLAHSMNAKPMKLTGNPVAEHFLQLLKLVDTRNVMSIQLVADSHGKIGGVFIGNLEDSFLRAIPLAEELYSRRVSEPFDMILCEILPPLDKNMYQAQKALENCQAGARDGGTVVVMAKCEEGIGSKHFFSQAAAWDKENNRPIDGNYKFGSHKLARMIASQKRVDVRLYSDLEDDIVEKVFYHPAGDLEKLIEKKSAGFDKFRLGVVHDSAQTVLNLIRD